MIKVITLGTGGPLPNPERHSACTVVQIDDEYLMFDAGRGTLLGASRKGIAFSSIDPLFITHHHVDHIGELPDYFIASWLGGRRHTLQVFGPPGTRAT